jgi:hypothetical protein
VLKQQVSDCLTMLVPMRKWEVFGGKEFQEVNYLAAKGVQITVAEPIPSKAVHETCPGRILHHNIGTIGNQCVQTLDCEIWAGSVVKQ